MKIALACPNFPPEFLGGTERVSLALARALQNQGEEILVIAGSDRLHGGDDVIAEDSEGIPVRRLARTGAEEYGLDLRRPRIQALVDRVLESEGIEVLHVQHWSTLCTGMLRAARARGLICVATLHDLWTACPRFFRRPPAGFHCPPEAGRDACVACADHNLDLGDRVVRPALAQRDRELQAELGAAHAITVPSQASAERIRKHLPWSGDLQVIPHGLLEPIAKVVPGPRPEGPLRIGSFGNLVEEKGIALLVQAMQGVPGAELHLFGPFLDDDFRSLIEKRAQDFSVDLHCHGPWSASDPHPAESLDLAVFPSLCEESYGLVVEEALARRVPVLVSHRGALRERIGTGGEVVCTDTVAPLAAKLADLQQNPQKLIELRRGIAEDFLSIDDAAARYLGIYRQSRENA